MNARSPAARDAWALIEVEKRRDRLIRRVCVAAWAVTFGIVLLFAAFAAVQVAQFVGPASRGEVPWAIVFGSAMPFIIALWTLSLLVATLATIGVFLRFRTSSLTEIQLRLAALEDMLASRPDAEPARRQEGAS